MIIIVHDEGLTIVKAGIIGTGHYVPENVVTNFDLEKIVDTSDEWIRTRTGIEERRIAKEQLREIEDSCIIDLIQKQKAAGITGDRKSVV